jgi:hypothetical protein
VDANRNYYNATPEPQSANDVFPCVASLKNVSVQGSSANKATAGVNRSGWLINERCSAQSAACEIYLWSTRAFSLSSCMRGTGWLLRCGAEDRHRRRDKTAREMPARRRVLHFAWQSFLRPSLSLSRSLQYRTSSQIFAAKCFKIGHARQQIFKDSTSSNSQEGIHNVCFQI